MEGSRRPDEIYQISTETRPKISSSTETSVPNHSAFRKGHQE